MMSSMLSKATLMAATAAAMMSAVQLAADEAKAALKVKELKNGPVKLYNDDYFGGGLISEWLICGPFANPDGRKSFADKDGKNLACKGWNTDFLKSGGGEEGVEPLEGMEVKHESNVRKWVYYQSPGPKIDFLELFTDEQTHLVAYAACYLKAEKARDMTMKLGSDDGYKLYVNHKLVSENHIHRANTPDEDTVKIHLEQGLNLILLKVDTDLGDFSFIARLAEAAGGAPENITLWH